MTLLGIVWPSWTEWYHIIIHHFDIIIIGVER